MTLIFVSWTSDMDVSIAVASIVSAYLHGTAHHAIVCVKAQKQCVQVDGMLRFLKIPTSGEG